MADFFVILFGLVVGSFLNVCIYRLPRDLSLVRPGSSCPKCEKAIRWYDNVPVLSYLLLRGRCRACRARISPRYAAVEILNALIWLGLWHQPFSRPEFIFSAVLFSILLAVFFTDMETGLIPDELSLGGLALGLVFAVLVPGHFEQNQWSGALRVSVIGALIGGGSLYLTGLFGKLVFRKESMGLGDVKLLAMLGAFVGLQGVCFIFLLAPVLALPPALYERWIHKEETIPFGPYLALAGAVVYLWQKPIAAYFF